GASPSTSPTWPSTRGTSRRGSAPPRTSIPRSGRPRSHSAGRAYVPNSAGTRAAARRSDTRSRSTPPPRSTTGLRACSDATPTGPRRADRSLRGVVVRWLVRDPPQLPPGHLGPHHRDAAPRGLGEVERIRVVVCGRVGGVQRRQSEVVLGE